MQRQLLWTGGWDSTFRLLELAITHESPPHTHYLVDPTRPSSLKEQETMDQIRECLAGRGVYVPEPHVINVSEVQIDSEAEQWAKTLRRAAPFGSQYVWLYSYAKELDEPLELSIHIDDRAAAFLGPHAEQVEDDPGGNWMLKVEVPPEMEIFRPFRFPILPLTKIDMHRRAEQAGFSDLLELTWFCHTPLHGEPCGVCAPCRFTIEEGLARRVPLVNRITAHVRMPVEKLRRRLGRLLQSGA